jgi:hypothetical protein
LLQLLIELLDMLPSPGTVRLPHGAWLPGSYYDMARDGDNRWQPWGFGCDLTQLGVAIARMCTWTMVGVFLVVAVVGCSSGSTGNARGDGDQADDSTSVGSADVEPSGPSTADDDGPGPTSESLGGSPATPTSTSTLPPGAVPLSEEEAACVAERAGDPSALSPAEMRKVSDDCVQIVSLAPVMVQGLQEQYPGVYTEEDLACLVEAYAGLEGDDLLLLRNAGLFPESDDAQAGVDVLAGMFESCEVEPPPALADAASN